MGKNILQRLVFNGRNFCTDQENASLSWDVELDGWLVDMEIRAEMSTAVNADSFLIMVPTTEYVQTEWEGWSSAQTLHAIMESIDFTAEHGGFFHLGKLRPVVMFWDASQGASTHIWSKETFRLPIHAGDTIYFNMFMDEATATALNTGQIDVEMYLTQVLAPYRWD